jgi:hypothetical protein
MSEPVAGAPMVWPAWDPVAGVVHLARTEARRDRSPALLAVCPDGPRVELELVPARRFDRVRRPRRWCEDCADYRDYLARAPST